jgi:hypothetical protein
LPTCNYWALDEMRTGRPPKPTEQKRLLGNPGKRRLPTGVVVLEPAERTPIEPIASGDDLVAELLAGPASAWIAQPDRLGLMQLLRDAWDERRIIRQALFLGPPEDWEPKVVVVWFTDERRALRELEKQITAWLSLLGLSPTDRSRLGVAEVKPRSHLETLRARRDGRNRAG